MKYFILHYFLIGVKMKNPTKGVESSPHGAWVNDCCVLNLDEKFQKLKKEDFVVGKDTGSTYTTHPLIDVAGPTKSPETSQTTTATTTEEAMTTTAASTVSG